MKNRDNDIIEIMDEIKDVLDRTSWKINIPHHPTKIQRIIAKILFKQEFKKEIAEKFVSTK